MNKNELIEFSDLTFKNINYYVIQHGFELEVYNITNDKLNKRLVLNGDSIEIMINFIDYIFGKVIIQITINSTIKTIKAFVKERE